MPTIISAVDYGFRKVIQACLNPDQPESIHPDGSPHTGTPPLGTDPTLKPWEWCQDCRYNWEVQEFIWTGEELYKRGSDGRRIQKNNTDLLNEIRGQLTTPGTSESISPLVNVEL